MRVINIFAPKKLDVLTLFSIVQRFLRHTKKFLSQNTDLYALYEALWRECKNNLHETRDKFIKAHKDYLGLRS